VIPELENGLVSDGIEEVLTVNQTLEALLNDVEKRVEGNEAAYALSFMIGLPFVVEKGKPLLQSVK
jgi:hypothetical protein